MKRIRPAFVHINKIGIANPYHLHQQQLQRAELNNKKPYNVQLPPLAINPPPNTARIRKNQLSISANAQSPFKAEIVDPISKDNTIANDITTANKKENQKQTPVTSEYALDHSSDLLLEFEKKEIANYQDIYYIRQEKPQPRPFPSKIPNFFPYVQNDHIAYRYQQLELMGKGAFGSVIKCIDHKNGRRVAVKLIRDQLKYHDQTRLERDILKIMQGCNRVVRFLKSFTFRGFFCIVTELLYKDCYTILRRQRYYGFSLSTLQMIAKQLAEAISFAHKNNIIHCDIKPENVMFTNKRKISVKLVDYGCSCYEDNTIFSYIQSRYFRAPEVALGLKYGTEIDVWSYACVLVELFTGKPLFPAASERELIEMFVSYFGNPPLELIQGKKRAEKFFDSEGKLKGNDQISPFSRQIDEIFDIHKNDEDDEEEEEQNEGVKQLCDLVKKCFYWLPNERIKMEDILNHPFITNPDIKNIEPSHPVLSAR